MTTMSLTVPAVDYNSFIFAQGEELKTTSIKIAEAFGKRHDNVIRDIRKIIESIKDLSNALKFEGVNYLDAKGESRTMYEMGKDEFVLVVMGYTGEAAMKIKVAYINAFNFMLMKLKPVPNALRDLPPAYLNHDMKRHIQEMVHARKISTGVHYNTTYDKLKTHFQTSTYAEIPIVKYADVCAWFGEKPKYDLPQMVSIDVCELEALRNQKQIVTHSIIPLGENEVSLLESRYFELAKAEEKLKSIIDSQSEITYVKTETQSIISIPELIAICNEIKSFDLAIVPKQKILALKDALSDVI